MIDLAARDQGTLFKIRVENIAPWTLLKSGATTAKLSGAGGPLGPGDACEVAFTAGKHQYLSFVTMLGESNDWFFGAPAAGIALYDDAGHPTSGDVTSQVALYDAGTEVNEEPAVGPDTGPRQGMPDQGAPDPDPTVRILGDVIPLSAGGTFTRPAIAAMIKVTLTPTGNRGFVLHVENVSTDATLLTSQGARPVHLSPVFYAVHTGPDPLFSIGSRDRGLGLERLAEAGQTAPLVTSYTELTGNATPVSPGVYVVHTSGEPLFTVGSADRGLGLEHVAEDGNVWPLASAFAAALPAGARASGVFNTPVGAPVPGAAQPGSAFEFTVRGRAGDRLSFAAMFGQSDDWVFATPPDGIPLFDASGEPLAGDVSDDIAIYDVGTEQNEELAIGPDTGPQQPAPDTGPADPIAQVRPVSPAEYGRLASDHVHVTLTPVSSK